MIYTRQVSMDVTQYPNALLMPRIRGHMPERGFTLIELSIVLVIIGLIVGAVLVGQDLIKASEVRSTVGQIEKYSSAVNTFRSKYNSLPGDITSGASAQFGMTTRAGTVGRGDGNGLLEGSASTSSRACAETVLFWTDMTFASLVDGNFVGADGAIGTTDCTVFSGVANVATAMPPAKIGKGNFLSVYANGGYNYFHIFGGVTAITNVGVFTNAAVALSPNEVYQMDVKVDDGYPATGAVTARDVAFAANAVPAIPAAAAPTAGVCISNVATPNTYNTDATNGGSSNACSARFRFN